jgi:threonine aldolase
VYGEDPAVNELEALAAESTGKEAALFVPSGSMANLIAELVHVRRGDEVILGRNAHAVRYETGAGAAIAGAQYEVLPGDGRFTADDVRRCLRTPNFHQPGTALVWIENTHNVSGGRIFPADEIARIGALCREHRLPLHIDGARIFNASVASGVPVREIVAPADTVSFCLSKGLGAPAGSLLCCTRETRVAAHRFRKMLGGAMRQSGILAAAGTYALRRHVDRLAEDHRRAHALAERLAVVPGFRIDPTEVETNILVVEVRSGAAPRLSAAARAAGVLCNPIDDAHLRLVTHLDVDDAGIDRAASVLAAAAV